MDTKKLKKAWKKTWYFIWEDDSALSWIVNIALAFLLIKFIVYPGLGLIFSTDYPVVAVVSGSMEHDGSYDDFWSDKGAFYEDIGITKEEFQTYPFRNGFNTGDIMTLFGTPPAKIEVGDVIVFSSSARPDPIIHRVIEVRTDETSDEIFFTTKGDHNDDIHLGIGEQKITTDRYIGRAVFRLPFLGYIKIWAVKLWGFAVKFIN